MLAVTYPDFNSSDIYMVTINQTVHINPILFGVLAVILRWVSINVTNCADGVDGLSGNIDNSNTYVNLCYKQNVVH